MYIYCIEFGLSLESQMLPSDGGILVEEEGLGKMEIVVAVAPAIEDRNTKFIEHKYKILKFPSRWMLHCCTSCGKHNPKNNGKFNYHCELNE